MPSTSTPHDSTRRDALARGLCARIVWRSADDLELLDVVLSQLEAARTTPLIAQLERDRYIASENDPTLYRLGWLHASRHAVALVRIHTGLDELRRSAAFAAEHELGGEG